MPEATPTTSVTIPLMDLISPACWSSAAGCAPTIASIIQMLVESRNIYGSDTSIYEDVSPVSHIDKDSVATFIAAAEFENPLIDVYCFELAYRLAAAKGRAPPLVWLKGHNHTSIIGHFNTAEDILGQACLEFIVETRARQR